MTIEFEFNLPTKIEFGRGKLKKLGNFINDINGKKVLIVTDKGLVKSGIIDKVKKILDDEKISYTVFDEVKPNPKDVDCERAYKLALQENVDSLIGIGGGSSMDTAKAVGTLLTHGGKLKNWYGFDKLRKTIPPLICIPTTAGTGSEITTFSVITDTETNYKMNIVDLKVAPQIALLDPELTISLPKEVTASTGMDALTHAIEAYTCNVSQPITDGLALHAIDLITEHLPIVVKDGENMESRERMLAASLMAGISFGNADVASVHCMAESLGGLYDTPHGVANSMMLPYVFEYNIPSNMEKHSIIARRLGADKFDLEKNAYEGVLLLKKLAEDLNIPRMSDLEYINPEDFEYLAEGALNNISHPSNPRKIMKKDYVDLFKKIYAE
ncbi:iron-containing alcohol dehydrogenase [Lentibacillus halophilus]|uniref:Iron-containing alcohol dehydrogenase n=1 Tax=Lentibacillus halophilus TaxID=295065 RepID=A0ABN0Z246_9BACI